MGGMESGREGFEAASHEVEPNYEYLHPQGPSGTFDGTSLSLGHTALDANGVEQPYDAGAAGETYQDLGSTALKY